MTKFEETLEYLLGRNGEFVMHAFAMTHGCQAFDISGTAGGKAPVLNKADRNIAAPDSIIVRNYPMWAEYKTKTTFYDPGKGVHDIWISQGFKAPSCYYHGIPTKSYNAYKDADRSNMPVVLWFLTRETGHLHAAPLSALTPYPSVDEHYDVVNFPLIEMVRVVTFNPKKLNQYFNSARSGRLPTPDQCRLLMEWLAPTQLEFDSFVDHLLDVLEKQWKGELVRKKG